MAPPTGRWLAAAALVGGVPCFALMLLLAGGAVDLVPGLLALGATAAGALMVARIWLGNLGSLGAALRQAVDGEGKVPELTGPLLLPSVAEVAETARRVARALQARTEQVSRLRQSDEAIIEILPDPLVVLDAGGAALRANAEARALFGAMPGGNSPVGGDLAALLRHPALAEAVSSALASGTTQSAEVALPVPVQRELRVNAVPMDPPLADGGRLLLVLSDRTRDRAVERMRADFVANASHELRTPLASLIGFIETLRGPAEDDREARARFLGIMAEQADRMRRLIDDLLGLSRIEITEHQPPTGRVDLGALVAAELEALAPVLSARGARVSVQAPAGLVAAPADGGQVAQVLRNLLENAVRYGRGGRHDPARRGARRGDRRDPLAGRAGRGAERHR
jgi:two-component system phosphate regulon sensor histidine kinase PhoR